jgi:hypothetical protein
MLVIPQGSVLTRWLVVHTSGRKLEQCCSPPQQGHCAARQGLLGCRLVLRMQTCDLMWCVHAAGILGTAVQVAAGTHGRLCTQVR